MLHEVNFLSYNKRDQVQGWIYVPAARPKRNRTDYPRIR